MTQIECFVDDDIKSDAALSLYNPLEALFSQYEHKKAGIEELANIAKDRLDLFSYFVDGASVENDVHGYGAIRVFDVEPAIRSLDAEYWSKAMSLTDCLELMPEKRRSQWNLMIAKRFVDHVDDRGCRVMENNQPVVDSIPAFQRDTVLATMSDLMASRQKFLGERVSGLFYRLSGSHLTNAPEGFSKRMILDRVFDVHGYLNYGVSGYIHDLRCIVAKFSGRDEPFSRTTDRSIAALVNGNKFSEWTIFDGGAIRLRLFKKGTIHIEVNPDVAYRLNQVLAWMHPMAIPSQFRTKPTKAVKEFTCEQVLLSFKVLSKLETMLESYSTRNDADEMTLGNPDSLLSQDVKDVLQFLGGVNASGTSWKFDYKIKEVVQEVIRTGVIPEQKSHQFYPTPKTVVDEVLAMAQIEGASSFLEPSAGHGAIADQLPKNTTVCVEIAPLQCKILESKGFNVHCADFLTWNVNQKFDRIIMNPPFSKSRAEDHVKHAATMLASNGVLVAVVPASYKNKVVVDGMRHDWSRVYTDEFVGTNVSVVIVKIQHAV